MPRKKIPLIDVIKINSKKIDDILSKYKGGIDEIRDGRNQFLSKKTPDRSSFKKHENDYKYIMRFEKKARDASAAIINKLLKRKLVKIEPVSAKENNVNKEVAQEEPVTTNDDDVCYNKKLDTPLPQDYRSNFDCNSCNSCNASKSFVSNFHGGIDASIFTVHEEQDITEQLIDTNANEIGNEDSISNDNNISIPIVENVSDDESNDVNEVSDQGSVDNDNDESDEDNFDDNNDDIVEESVDDDSEDDDSNIECFNCCRSKNGYYNYFSSLYQLEFFEVNSSVIRKRAKFKNYPIDYNDTDLLYPFCYHCTTHLTCEDSDKNDKPEFTWPAFIWYILINEDLRTKYGVLHLWKFIPIIWRHWWIDAFKESIPDMNERNSISIEFPKPFFIDRTPDIEEWNSKISSYTLPNLAYAMNKNALPTVSCPYGCSAFIFRHRKVAIDIILQKFLRKSFISKCILDKHAIKFVETVRDDFIRDYDDYDCWLLNDDWKILPSIYFDEGVPYVMTCDEHDHGSIKSFVHPPRSAFNNNLPSIYSDQLSHCSIRTRTIKPMAKKYYSTAFQMHEQRANFNGIDTCNISTYRQFNFNSSLLSKFEAVSIVNRPDINALLNQLVEEKIISKEIANGKRTFASKLTENIDFTKYHCGPTYVPFEACMSMQRDLRSSLITVTIDNR